MQLIRDKYERQLTGGLKDLKKEDVRAAITRDVQQATAHAQGSLEGVLPQTDVAQLVAEITASIAENSIEIPEIVVLPSREVNFWFEDFDLGDLATIRFQPSSDKILIRNMRDEAQRELARGTDGPSEARPENYIIRHLIDFPEVDYDSQADLLYKLAGQVVQRLREYLPDEEAVEATALEHGKALARFIHAQMKSHYRETPVDYQAKRVKSFKMLGPQQFAYSAQRMLPITQAADPLSATRSYTFSNIRRSPYPFAKFDSDPERRFACRLEQMGEVIRWLRPAPGQFNIEYAGGKPYEPDFVVETTTEKVIVEVKADNELDDPIVQDKARAARTWAKHANEFAAEGDGKTWSYSLLSERDVTQALTWRGVLAHAQAG
jgi:type III restriction enzyme